MSTTLPLFWHISSSSTNERLDASIKLIGALERFQADFKASNAKRSDESEEDPELDEDEDASAGEATKKGSDLDTLNAQDVAYSIRRLVRGLASPRESSRLGFAVALTELLSRIDTVTCSQIVALIIDSSKTQGSMTGQEERDMLFARLFGLTSVIQSGLLTNTALISPSASSTTSVSSLACFTEVLNELFALANKRSWLRESVWWTIGLALEAVNKKDTSEWRQEAIEEALKKIYVENKVWTSEKIAITVKLQKIPIKADWRAYPSPTFKQADILHSSNYATLSRILKDASVEDDEDADVKASAASWKPQVHNVWDVLLDQVLSSEEHSDTFPEFFRILVDESLFSSSSSPERKYWGFQIFQKALPRVSPGNLPMLFTKNFMRSWINHLSNSDRYLHKAAKQVANDIHDLVKKDPTLGFALILQLTGVHGSQQFDKLTKTKTVETILTVMNDAGIQKYLAHLLAQVNDTGRSKTEITVIHSRRIWVIDQFTALIRNGAIPKDDGWVTMILDWLATQGLFVIQRKNEKSEILALREVPQPVFSDDLRQACRERLLACLAELTNSASVVVKDDTKNEKVVGVGSDGRYWVWKVFQTIGKLQADPTHATPTISTGPEQALWEKATTLAGSLAQSKSESAAGAHLLLAATLVHAYCTHGEDDDQDTDTEQTLEACVDAVSRMFPQKDKKKSKASKSDKQQNAEDVPEPVDILVDAVIGFSDKGTAYMRAVANQVFALLSGSVKPSTIDLIVAQLERREGADLMDEDEDESGEDESVRGETDEDGDEQDNAEDEEEPSSSDSEDEDEDEDMEEDPELRRKIEEALRVNGIQPATGESDDESEEELMDDDQMMAIDKQLTAVFKARADEKRMYKGVDLQREATHYKNRVLDLVDLFLRKQATSPLIIRFILPLVELIVGSSPDEKQLCDKATGILRSRIGKAKDLPALSATEDQEQAITVLTELHNQARKAHTSEILATLNQCSLFISKALLHVKVEQPVVKVYRDSLRDFVGRKASRLNYNFLQEFAKRFPGAAWSLRTDLLDVINDAVNGYRTSQCHLLVNGLISQVIALGGKSHELLTFFPALRQSLADTITKACNPESGLSLSNAQGKETLKIALASVRQSKRVLTSIGSSTPTLVEIWQPSVWDTVADAIANAEAFKSSKGFPAMCKQVVDLVNGTDSQRANKPAPKRKADDASMDAEATLDVVKAKRKKVRKNKPQPTEAS